ncbi:MAG: hypothetical protein KGJ58_03430 [Patescibacteria group bacterium]|nr:hypothetical protein [Patescibacteria group bacterium]MDE2218474.1 hypothetical protein [Patescibacteria group bacterium]
MLKLINKFLNPKSKVPKSISGFLKCASKKQKDKIIIKVARKANADQRALVEKYDKMFPKTT